MLNMTSTRPLILDRRSLPATVPVSHGPVCVGRMSPADQLPPDRDVRCHTDHDAANAFRQREAALPVPGAARLEGGATALA